MVRGRSAQLPETAIQILVALGPDALHGYAILGEIVRLTDGRVRPGTGTLYTTIKRLLADGLIEEVDRPDETEDERRRYYRLTGAGREVVSAELRRLSLVVDHGRAAGLLPTSR